MGFLDKLSSSVSETAKTLTKRSADLVEISKLNLSIRKREEEIQELYETLGQYVHARLKKMQYINREDVEEYLRKIEALETDIQVFDKMVLKMRNINFCDKCDIEMDDDVRYCPLCGKYLGR